MISITPDQSLSLKVAGKGAMSVAKLLPANMSCYRPFVHRHIREPHGETRPKRKSRVTISTKSANLQKPVRGRVTRAQARTSLNPSPSSPCSPKRLFFRSYKSFKFAQSKESAMESQKFGLAASSAPTSVHWRTGMEPKDCVVHGDDRGFANKQRPNRRFNLRFNCR